MSDMPASLGSSPQEFKINPLIARLALRTCERCGIDIEMLCTGLGFTPADVQRPDFRISYAQASTLIQRVINAIGDPAIGLKAGASLNIVSWGIMGLGSMASTDMLECMKFGVQFQTQAGSMLDIAMDTDDSGVCITASPMFCDVQIEPVLVDGTFAALVQCAKQLCQLRPSKVEMVSARVAPLKVYQDIFGCPVDFGCLHNRLYFNLHAGQYPLASSDSVVFQTVQAMLVKEADVPKSRELEQALRRLVRERVAQVPTMEDAAALLGVGERHLRRKLIECGLSYTGIVDDERKTRALELLLHARRPFDEVAQLVGFNDPRSLRRAYKRWTGLIWKNEGSVATRQDDSSVPPSVRGAP